MLVAVYFNKKDVRMLLLTFIVAAGIFIPIPDKNFYYWCIVAEIGVALSSAIIWARASIFIIFFSIQLIFLHLSGMNFNGYLENSPYRIAVKITESSELLTCILLSKPILRRIIDQLKRLLPKPILIKIKEKLKCQNTFPH